MMLAKSFDLLNVCVDDMEFIVSYIYGKYHSFCCNLDIYIEMI